MRDNRIRPWHGEPRPRVGRGPIGRPGTRGSSAREGRSEKKQPVMAEDEQAAMRQIIQERQTRQNTTLRFALAATRFDVSARSDRGVTRAHCALLVLLAFTLGACDLGGSGGGGSAPVAATNPGSVAAATIIDLPAGQQTATLAWSTSEGLVSNYLVYESRNDADYEFTGSVIIPRTTISGTGGDGVRVAVLAVNVAGTSSEASVPSPEIRFHDAAAAVAAGPPMPAPPTPTALPLDPSGAPNSAGSAETVVAAQTLDASDASAGPVENTDVADNTEASDETVRERISDSLRSLLLDGDARLPISGLEPDADDWLQARVDDEFRAGVRLVGTGERDQDGLRELVWQDAAGQIFVSAGQAVEELADTEDVPSTFEQAIRLGATEHYVALADFDGDTVGDWVVEDSATGAVWIIDGVTLAATDARGASGNANAKLVGYGDFDGDRRQEFLWESAEGQISIQNPSGAVTSIAGASDLSTSAGGRMLAVADVDGDGRDDLIALDAQGQIRVSLVQSDATSALYFDHRVGSRSATEGLQLVATIDHDEDGRSELVWLNAGEIEAWDPEFGPEAL